jgi:uncharacterized membrane protein YwaF
MSDNYFWSQILCSDLLLTLWHKSCAEIYSWHCDTNLVQWLTPDIVTQISDLCHNVRSKSLHKICVTMSGVSHCTRFVSSDLLLTLWHKSCAVTYSWHCDTNLVQWLTPDIVTQIWCSDLLLTLWHKSCAVTYSWHCDTNLVSCRFIICRFGKSLHKICVTMSGVSHCRWFVSQCQE